MPDLRFVVHAQAGSHVKLDTGTLRAIFGQASQYVPDQELRPHFFAE